MHGSPYFDTPGLLLSHQNAAEAMGLNEASLQGTWSFLTSPELPAVRREGCAPFPERTAWGGPAGEVSELRPAPDGIRDRRGLPLRAPVFWSLRRPRLQQMVANGNRHYSCPIG